MQLVAFAFLFEHRFCNTQVFRDHELNISVQNKQNLDNMCKTYKNKPLQRTHTIFTHVLYVFKSKSKLNKTIVS